MANLHCRAFFLLLLLVAVCAQADSSGPGVELFKEGKQLLLESEELLTSANTAIQLSNELRKSLIENRRKALNSNPSENQSTLNLIQSLRNEANQQRSQAKQYEGFAIEKFKNGLHQLFPDWLNSQQPFVGSTNPAHNQLAITAHNTLEQSVHPNVPRTQTQRSDASENLSMTLGAESPGSQQPINDINTETTQLSRNKQFAGAIVGINSEGQNTHLIPLHSLHEWNLLLANTEGQKITQASIEFSGHMPGHVHGLPTQPRITNELSPGVYKIEGVKFQMSGWWVIDLNITANGVSDTLRFNLQL